MPSPAPGRGALDEPRDVGDDEAAIGVDAHDAELRMQRRERIVGDLRSRRRQRARQRGLAGVRRTEQADVRQQLQRELQVPALAGLADVELARRPIHAGLEPRVAAAALPAFRDEQLVAVARQIAELLAGVEIVHLGALGHLDVEIGAGLAGHVLARAAAAALGAKPPLHAEVRERVDALARDEIDAAAVAAVAAVRAAARDELLAPKAHAAAAAGTGLDANVGFIDEFHDGSTRELKRKSPALRGFVTNRDALDASPRARSPCGGSSAL